jgi:hypothetical protein
MRHHYNGMKAPLAKDLWNLASERIRLRKRIR